MRKITKDAYQAFLWKKKFTKGNTYVEPLYGEVYMYLFGNLIAKTENGNTLINHCGYITATTQERLNAFDVKIRRKRKKGQFIVNEKFIWKDGWLNINELR